MAGIAKALSATNYAEPEFVEFFESLQYLTKLEASIYDLENEKTTIDKVT